MNLRGSSAKIFTRLNRRQKFLAEMQLAEMRRQQLAAWAAKGWTAKQAAAAGEAVVLNGSGYNLTGAPLR